MQIDALDVIVAGVVIAEMMKQKNIKKLIRKIDNNKKGVKHADDKTQK